MDISWLRERLDRRWFPWACLGVVALLGIAFALLSAIGASHHYRDAPPACYPPSIVGCIHDSETVGLLAAFLWALVLVPIAAVFALTELFWQPVAVARSMAALLLMIVAVLIVVWLGAAVVGTVM